MAKEKTNTHFFCVFFSQKINKKSLAKKLKPAIKFKESVEAKVQFFFADFRRETFFQPHLDNFIYKKKNRPSVRQTNDWCLKVSKSTLTFQATKLRASLANRATLRWHATRTTSVIDANTLISEAKKVVKKTTHRNSIPYDDCLTFAFLFFS